MVKKKTKKIKSKISQQAEATFPVAMKKSEQKNLLSQLNIGESYASLLLGLIVVVAAAALLVLFVKPNRSQNTSSTRTDIMSEKKTEKTATMSATPAGLNQGEPTEEKITGTTYTVKEGDGGLWYIAVRAYGNGERWPDIAKANNLSSPDAITEGMILKIPR